MINQLNFKYCIEFKYALYKAKISHNLIYKKKPSNGGLLLIFIILHRCEK